MSKPSLLRNSKKVCHMLLPSYFIFQEGRRDQISQRLEDPNLLVIVLTGYTFVLAIQVELDNLKESEICKTVFSILLFCDALAL